MKGDSHKTMAMLGTRVSVAEKEQLEELAAECKLSLCAYVRVLIQQELKKANRASSDT